MAESAVLQKWRCRCCGCAMARGAEWEDSIRCSCCMDTAAGMGVGKAGGWCCGAVRSGLCSCTAGMDYGLLRSCTGVDRPGVDES